MRILVTGGAGFLGTNLCRKLCAEGHRVVVIDDFSTAYAANGEALQRAGASLIRVDLSDPLQAEGVLRSYADKGAFDRIYHLACPASPRFYQELATHTLRTCSVGTDFALRLARQSEARLLLTSTSEIYGDPVFHPQFEEHWGNVNPIGPRSMYDEGKRFAEATVAAWRSEVDARIVRIFNTYGPHMRPDDGRMIPSFITRALRGDAIHIFGDGKQTRSLCYVSDLVDGLLQMMEHSDPPPVVNLGRPDERTVLEIAHAVIEATGSDSAILMFDRLPDDPTRRCPSIRRAIEYLGWEPKVSLEEGLQYTVRWFKEHA